MRATRTVEISTGLFVLLGFAALFFLVTQITNKELAIKGGSYEVTAQYENVGSLKPGAAVSMSGVTVGRVESIGYDQDVYKAVVRMRISSKYDRIPKDSDASIMTSGLLGGQYVGITAGGSDEFLKQGDRVELVQDAFVLENLVNQLFATFSSRGSGDQSGQQSGQQPGQQSGQQPGQQSGQSAKHEGPPKQESKQ